MNPSWLDIKMLWANRKDCSDSLYQKKKKKKKIVQTVNKNNYYDGGPFGEGRTN